MKLTITYYTSLNALTRDNTGNLSSIVLFIKALTNKILFLVDLSPALVFPL